MKKKNSLRIARRVEQGPRPVISTEVEDDKLATECKRKYINKNQSKSKQIIDKYLMNSMSYIKVSTFNVRTLKNVIKIYEIISSANKKKSRYNRPARTQIYT